LVFVHTVTMPKQNKARDADNMTGQKKKNYQVLDAVPRGEEAPPWYACDRKRCLGGRCGVCWLVICGLGLAVGISCILIFGDALGFTFSTDGNETLYELICDDCTFEPTYNPTVTPTVDPTSAPTYVPTAQPTVEPSIAPSVEPTYAPTGDPTVEPSGVPSVEPTLSPSDDPTVEPTSDPTAPTSEPTSAPTGEPTLEPTADPTVPTNEPTSAPTDEPTSDPTAERRMVDKSDMTSNVLLLIANGTGNIEFHTPEVGKVLKEGYTFTNLTKKHSLNSLISGSTVMQKAFPWVEQLRSKGYINQYYGGWLFGTNMEASNFDGRGWHTYRAINNHEEQILDEVQTAIRMLRDERWTITVGLSKPDADAGFRHHSKNSKIYQICSRYFKEGGPDFNHDRGVTCQNSMKSDEKIGEVFQTLKSSGVWEQTIVMLVIVGDRENMFSINGGALPAKFLSTINKDPHSFLDVVPTILSVAGFTDSQLRRVKLNGLPVVSYDQILSESF